MGALRNQLLSPDQIDSTAGPRSLAFERHYTPKELASLWKKDSTTIRRMFENEPGVLIDEKPETRKKRRYRSFSIPESVVERVHRRYATR